MCPNGSTKQAYISWKEATRTTAVSEAIINTEVIDEKKKRYVMTIDIPNAFIQTEIVLDRDNIIMKIGGQLVYILLKICPGVYDKYVW